MLDDFRPVGQKPKPVEPQQTNPQPWKPQPLNTPQPAVTERSQLPSVPVFAGSRPIKPKHFFVWKWTQNRRRTIAFALMATVLIGTGAVVAYTHQPPKDQGGVYITKRPKFVPKIVTVPSNLSGLQVDAAVNERPVIGVMIENSQDARPQSGLDQASVVFEAIAEGGITRFLALFQDTQPDYIGPVRSVRPYYVQWCMTFDCALAHAGGSPEALQNIRTWNTKDLNDARGVFWRADGRFAPHNLYTNATKINEYAASRGYGKATFTSFTRKAETAAKQPAASKINFNISSGLFNSQFDYDAKANLYKRSQAGGPHNAVDGSGVERQISPKVVIGLVMQYSIAPDKHSVYNVIGSGQAVVFQDGVATDVTWSKADLSAPLTLTGADGKPLAINAGQTWITALSARNLITYQ